MSSILVVEFQSCDGEDPKVFKSTDLRKLLNITTRNCRPESTELKEALHLVKIHELLRLASKLNYTKDSYEMIHN